MLESNIAGVASPLTCVALLMVVAVIAAIVTRRPIGTGGPRKRKTENFIIIDEMTPPTPQQLAQDRAEQDALKAKHEDMGRWWNS